VDVGTHVLEVVIAVAVILAAFALVVSGINEAWAQIWNLRSKQLKRWLKDFLSPADAGDERESSDMAAVEAFLSLAVIEPASDASLFRKRKRDPSYISPRSFAQAMITRLGLGSGKVGERVDALAPSKEKEVLQSLLSDPDASVSDVEGALAIWFDSQMERVSGWYKRRAQAFMFGFALLIAVAGNVDPVSLTRTMHGNAEVRSALVDLSGEGASDRAPLAAEDSINEQQADLVRTLLSREYRSLNFGWSEGFSGGGRVDAEYVLLKVAGLLLGAFALSLGAPFWFDVIGRARTLRFSGDPPER
jgi:hypothetical protein